jgi:lactate permease
MGCVQYVVAVSGLWNIGSFSGAIAGLLVAFPLAQRFRGTLQNDKKLDLRALAVALSGYLILILITLGVQLIPIVKNFLGQVVLQISFPEVSTSLGFLTPAGEGRKILLFRHAGATLIYAAVIAYLIYRRFNLYKPGAVGRIIQGTISKVLSSSVSIVSMVSMAVVMEHAGMTDALARGMASAMGMAFPLVSPWIGALGAFMTGSNTNSNVVFGALQLQTANLLQYTPAIILAGQTAGAALASVIAPTKVVVGASTAGMAGREGEVMSKLLVYTGLLVMLISLLTMAGIWLAG